MVINLNKICESNLSAITDERGDLLIDRRNHRLRHNGIQVPRIRIPNQGRIGNARRPVRGIRVLLTIIFMVVITAIMYQIMPHTEISERDTFPIQQGEEKKVETFSSANEDEQISNKGDEKEDTPEESLEVKGVSLGEKPPEGENSTPSQKDINTNAEKGDGQSPNSNVQSLIPIDKDDDKPVQADSIKPASTFEQQTLAERPGNKWRKIRETKPRYMGSRERYKNLIVYKNKSAGIVIDREMNPHGLKENKEMSEGDKKVDANPVIKPSFVANQTTSGNESSHEQHQPGINRVEKRDVQEIKANDEISDSTGKSWPIAKQREPVRHDSASYQQNFYQSQNDLRGRPGRQTYSGFAGDWESSRYRISYEDKCCR